MNCTLSNREFVRRFSLHIFPKGFTRIRHYGILSSTIKKRSLELIREQTGRVVLPQKRELIQLGVCPSCRKGKLITIAFFKSGRSPPKHLIKQIDYQNQQRQRA